MELWSGSCLGSRRLCSIGLRVAPLEASESDAWPWDLLPFEDWTKSHGKATSISNYLLRYIRKTRKRAPRPAACILYEEEMYTYAEVAWNANRTARWIRGSEPALKKGDVVCVLLYNGPTFVWTMLGLMKLGVVASFINFNLKGAALLHCIRVSNPKKLLIGSGNAISFWFSLNFLK